MTFAHCVMPQKYMKCPLNASSHTQHFDYEQMVSQIKYKQPLLLVVFFHFLSS